jgi:dihydrofolate reductase
MASLIYGAITSLDGYVEDTAGAITWGAPDEAVGAFVNDLERSVGTYLYGRRMYETMVYWETAHLEDQSPAEREFTEMWQAAEKVVYSRTLQMASSARTRIVRDFNVEEVRRLKASATADLTVSGAELAAQALRAGLVDELQLYVAPLAIGGGKPALPLGQRLDLTLRDEVRFASGFVHLRYDVGAQS